MATARRHRVKLEPITMEELAQDATLGGMLSFLQRPPTQDPDGKPLDISTAVKTSGVDTISKVHNQPIESQLDSIVSTPVDTYAVGTICEQIVSTPVEISPPGQTPEAVSIRVEPIPLLPASQMFLSRTKKRLFRPVRPSDGHTDGEDRLYQFMWERGQKHQPGVRLFGGSMRVLAQALGRDARNTRPLVESLIRKLSLQIARETDFRGSRWYYVFDYAEISRRRRQAGLEWALKNKGIQLLTAAEASALVAADAVSTPVETTPPVLTPVNTLDLEPTPVKTSVSTAVARPVSTPVKTSLIKKRNSKENLIGETTTTTRLLAEALRPVFGLVDAEALERIAAGARQAAPDARDEEIVVIAAEQARRIVRLKGIDNPLGLLIRQLPKCFTSESFRLFRQAEQQRREAERAQWQGVLDDPDMPDEQKQIARDFLKEIV
jgi:hypothetical protein